MYEINVINMMKRVKQLEQLQNESHHYEYKLPEFRIVESRELGDKKQVFF